MFTDLTYKIVTYPKADPGVIDLDDCVDWALEMMELGYESPNLYIVAGMQKPVLYSEIINYLKAALKELNLPELEGTQAHLSHSYYFVKKLAKGKELRSNLRALYSFYTTNYDDVIWDFYELYWAWDDLDYDDNSRHICEATRENIADLTLITAKEWLQENEHSCQQLLQVPL